MQWKQHHILYEMFINIIWHTRKSTIEGGGVWVLTFKV
jgi:hypothetical protein